MPDLPTIDIFDAAATEDWRRENRLDPELLRRIRNAKLKQYLPDDAIRQLSPLADAFCGTSLLLHERIESAVDGATKLLMRSHDGLLLETVILRIATGRTTLCVSSQIGCGAACDFCATGKMGLARNLSVREILEQVLIAGRELASEDRRIRNVVFMGMGEPFHNERNVTAAIELLTSPQYFDFAPTRLLVSSVGQCDGMLRFAGRFPRVNLAISLHSVRQETRERLIPLSRKFPLPALRDTIVEINRLQSCPVMVEYLMLDGQNDSIEDAALLAEWLRGLSVHLNLIPFNAIDDAPNLVASSPAAIRQFAEQMKELGITTTVRYSLGSDIAAACGQLVRKRIQSHPVTLIGLE